MRLCDYESRLECVYGRIWLCIWMSIGVCIDVHVSMYIICICLFVYKIIMVYFAAL